MKLIPLKCEFCGGRLKRVSSDTVACRFCKMAYLVHEEPKQPIAIPEEEPQIEVATTKDVVEPGDEYEPCEAELEICRLMAENEYAFWLSLPSEPEVEKSRGKLRIAQPDNVLLVPLAFALISVLVGLVVASGNQNAVLYWIAGVCLAIACVLGFRGLVTLVRVNLLIDQFVKQQTAYRKQIQDLRGY